MDSGSEETDLYEVLGITSDASKTEIKKAYHKAALTHHPDKVAENEREEAEVKFKSVSQAYEILYDDEKRHMYDTHGMAAFDPSASMHAQPDMDDILAQMFGMGGGMGGMPGMGGMGGGGPRRPRKGKNEEQEYEVTLEELYKGKTTRFASTKNVICQVCKGSGGKEKAKPHQCATCHGAGTQTRLASVGPGLVSPTTTTCSTCSGFGTIFKEQNRCKKCKGKRVVETRKILELYIPRGSRQGDLVVLAGEADQMPDQEPGDIVFELVEVPHETFSRAGSDLKADLHVTLAEALTGIHRTVLKHLDGRGIKLNIRQPKGRVLRPGQILKIAGEGMPVKKSDVRGDLYLEVHVDFPEDGWLGDEAAAERVRAVLPAEKKDDLQADDVDDINEDDLEWDADIEEMGAGSDDPRAGAEWEDDEGMEGQPQCAAQ
ncbi:DnaJ domain-containing protein mas5 [Saccharata proteae CBS 121410]|uniref:DnaJ domain-containing protein mas5 n=1 Tax=Saccharata proteae CBS 121410 TaxID=1314787 RepID=A0A9P4HWR0_9PEZI|nr:DnaJ domain-containing protein mas5 [Saccharata proteae CBS 121410]